MRKFTDSQGREWNLTTTLGVQLEIYASHKIDIRDVEVFSRIVGEPKLRWDIIGEVCAAQIEKRGLTPKEFVESLTPDDIDGVEQEFFAGVIDFFPVGQRAKMKKIWEEAVSLAVTTMDRPELDKMIQDQVDLMKAEMEKILTGTSTGN